MSVTIIDTSAAHRCQKRCFRGISRFSRQLSLTQGRTKTQFTFAYNNIISDAGDGDVTATWRCLENANVPLRYSPVDCAMMINYWKNLISICATRITLSSIRPNTRHSPKPCFDKRTHSQMMIEFAALPVCSCGGHKRDLSRFAYQFRPVSVRRPVGTSDFHSDKLPPPSPPPLPSPLLRFSLAPHFDFRWTFNFTE